MSSVVFPLIRKNREISGARGCALAPDRIFLTLQS